jgi:hypothetical protein
VSTSEDQVLRQVLDDLTYETLIRENEQLRQAVLGRDLIGQAKGAIRLLARCGDDAAFEVLSRVSQLSNRKLRDVAAVIADCAATGTALPRDIASPLRREMARHARGPCRRVGETLWGADGARRATSSP